MQEERHETMVGEDLDGSRIDRAVARLLPQYSRSFVARLISEGRLRLDGQVVAKSSHPVHTGQRVSVEVPPAAAPSMESQEMPLAILYDDSDLAVINKPAGLVVHPGAGHLDRTLVNALLFHLGSLSGIGGVARPGIIHRLDKDTSGVMIVAKNDLAHRKLSEIWGTELVRKEYLALVYGQPKTSEGTIDAPIGRDPGNRKRMAVVAGGRKAVTVYRLVEQFRYVSLLRCTLRTGRTHQIRVHLKSIGHPIVGDPVYSGPQWRGIPDRRLQKVLGSFGRQALHAARISFPHPATGERITVEAPLPEDFAGLLAELRG